MLFRSKLALQPLLSCLSDSSARVRYESLRSLEPLLESTHQKAILDLFEDTSRMVRLSAVRLVGKTPSRLVFNPLLEMLADPDSDVRSLASYALSRYPDKYVGRILDELASSHWLKKNQIFQTMLLIGNRSHESISKALREKNLAREKQY